MVKISYGPSRRFGKRRRLGIQLGAPCSFKRILDMLVLRTANRSVLKNTVVKPYSVCDMDGQIWMDWRDASSPQFAMIDAQKCVPGWRQLESDQKSTEVRHQLRVATETARQNAESARRYVDLAKNAVRSTTRAAVWTKQHLLDCQFQQISSNMVNHTERSNRKMQNIMYHGEREMDDAPFLLEPAAIPTSTRMTESGYSLFPSGPQEIGQHSTTFTILGAFGGKDMVRDWLRRSTSMTSPPGALMILDRLVTDNKTDAVDASQLVRAILYAGGTDDAQITRPVSAALYNLLAKRAVKEVAWMLLLHWGSRAPKQSLRGLCLLTHYRNTHSLNRLVKNLKFIGHYLTHEDVVNVNATCRTCVLLPPPEGSSLVIRLTSSTAPPHQTGTFFLFTNLDVQMRGRVRTQSHPLFGRLIRDSMVRHLRLRGTLTQLTTVLHDILNVGPNCDRYHKIHSLDLHISRPGAYQDPSILPNLVIRFLVLFPYLRSFRIQVPFHASPVFLIPDVDFTRTIHLSAVDDVLDYTKLRSLFPSDGWGDSSGTLIAERLKHVHMNLENVEVRGGITLDNPFLQVFLPCTKLRRLTFVTRPRFPMSVLHIVNALLQKNPGLVGLVVDLGNKLNDDDVSRIPHRGLRLPLDIQEAVVYCGDVRVIHPLDGHTSLDVICPNVANQDVRELCSRDRCRVLVFDNRADHVLGNYKIVVERL